MLDPNDPRMENLRRASQITMAQKETIQKELDKLSDEELNLMLDQDENLRDFISVGADQDNSGIVVNYANQPQNQQISFQPSWNGTGGMNQQTANLFGNLFGMNWGYNNTDKRYQMYQQHPGMKLYNLNPYNFYDENQLFDYYQYLEDQRKQECDMNYVFSRMGATLDGSKEAIEWAEQFKFKPADDIVKEQQEARLKADEERRKEIYGEDGRKTVYGVYDANGYRFERAPSFRVRNAETGEIVLEVNHKKDENGRSYVIHSITEDRKRAYEMQVMYTDHIRAVRFGEAFRELFNKDYYGNIAKWNSWNEMGLSIGDKMKLYEDEQVDWEKHAKLVQKALITSSYSRDKFSEILKKCCHTELDYANKSQFFSLSYDFERDLKYKSLISTPEEMQNDPLVHQKLQEEYEIKRKQFLDKVYSGNLGCNMMIDANYHPTFPKPNLDDLTLEDFEKPENHVMYTQIVTPEIATKNLFIPEATQKQPESMEDILAMNGVKLDANGQVIPSQRTVGIMTVDDDTGQIISQQEWDMTPDTECRSANNDMTNEELGELF